MPDVAGVRPICRVTAPLQQFAPDAYLSELGVAIWAPDHPRFWANERYNDYTEVAS